MEPLSTPEDFIPDNTGIDIPSPNKMFETEPILLAIVYGAYFVLRFFKSKDKKK